MTIESLTRTSRSTVSASQTQRIAIMGSTGSIGCNTLDVILQHKDTYDVFALTAHNNAELLLEQCRQFSPRYAVLCSDTNAKWLDAALRSANCDTELLVGPQALKEVAAHEDVDTVVAAIVGAAGLGSTLAAVQAAKKILLANKETLIVAGSLFMQAVKKTGAVLLPVDSEHNAIFQCLPASHSAQQYATVVNEGSNQALSNWGVRQLLLTGSGGPFLKRPLADFSSITPEQACAHPNWTMGKKISVDSATMMNKGLELLEACWLFACTESDIEIVIHPQSIIHSMVEYLDGSVLAQLGQPDMRTPIAHALSWPERIASPVERLNWSQIKALTFEVPDETRFPALKIARNVAVAGGSSAVIMNGANEVAVDAFLNKRIAFSEIVGIVEKCLEKMPSEEPDSLEFVQSVDDEVRILARSFVNA